MNEDFVTQLRLQLREAALREEHRAPLARGARARRRLPGPGPVAAALATAVLALAVALGALAVRGEPEPAQPKVVGNYPVAAGLSSLAPGFGAVWVSDPIGGEILRIDPATRRIVKRIPVPGEARVATGAGSVWVIAGDLQYAGDNGPVRLLRIDPATNRVAARISMRTPAGDRFAPVELQIDHEVVWAVGLNGALRIGPDGNAPDLYVPLAGASGDPRGIVTGGDSIWALTAGGHLRRYDARTGRATRDVPVREPVVHLFGGPPGRLSALTGKNRLALLERGTGRIVWRATLGDDIGWFFFDGAATWVQHSGAGRPDRLTRLDTETGRRSGQVGLPEPGVASMAKVGRDIWLATPAGRIIVVR